MESWLESTVLQKLCCAASPTHRYLLILIYTYIQYVYTSVSKPSVVMHTIFPRSETAVTKHFSSMVPQFLLQGRLLYEGWLLIFHQGCELVMRYCKAVALLYNICMHAVLFTWRRFRLKIQIFLYKCVFRLYENGENAHENG